MSSCMMDVKHVREVMELSFTGIDQADVRFKSPAGDTLDVQSFRDGADVWKVRFAPSMTGTWTWERLSPHSHEDGFREHTGVFEVVPYEGDNPIYAHGFLKVNEHGRGFVHEDGTPFLWLGDTAWASSSKADVEEWKHYTDYRSKQGFNMIQVNALPQFDAGGPHRSPFLPDGEGKWDLSRIDPVYFRYLDQLIAMTSRAGMFTAMIAIWFNYVEKVEDDTRVRFNTETAACYARYLAARYAAYGVVWLVSGDSRFNESEHLAVYESAATAIRETVPYPPLMSAHLCGDISTPDDLNAKSWLDFHMYQSGHCKDGVNIAMKYATADRALTPSRPVMNGEPCYEGIGYFRLPERVTREDVRRVAWASMLGGGNAGLTYGAHGLWAWHRSGEAFAYADAWLSMPAWKEALECDGASDVVRMIRFMQAFPWWELEPIEELRQMDENRCLVAAAIAEDQMIIYADGVGEIQIRVSDVGEYDVRQFDVVTGESGGCEYTCDGGTLRIHPHSSTNDAVFILSRL